MREYDWRVAALAALLLPAAVNAHRRQLQPEDLFRVQRVGAIAWSPDRHAAGVAQAGTRK